MSRARVSVVMAVHNGLPHLRAAVDSVLGQTFADFEFLIVDDGSTDGVAEYLASLDDARVRVTRTAHSGLTKALVAATSEAQGVYVARQDADDASEPRRFERQVALLDARPELSLLGAWYAVLAPDGRELIRREPPGGGELVRALRNGKNPLAHGSVMMRRSALETAGGYRVAFHYAQDYDLWLRISEQGEIDTLPEYLYRWRLPDAPMSALKRYQQRRCQALALECERARERGRPEPLDAVRAVRDQSPGMWWRMGFAAKETLRRGLLRARVRPESLPGGL